MPNGDMDHSPGRFGERRLVDRRRRLDDVHEIAGAAAARALREHARRRLLQRSSQRLRDLRQVDRTR